MSNTWFVSSDLNSKDGQCAVWSEHAQSEYSLKLPSLDLFYTLLWFCKRQQRPCWPSRDHIWARNSLYNCAYPSTNSLSVRCKWVFKASLVSDNSDHSSILIRAFVVGLKIIKYCRQYKIPAYRHWSECAAFFTDLEFLVIHCGHLFEWCEWIYLYRALCPL